MPPLKKQLIISLLFGMFLAMPIFKLSAQEDEPHDHQRNELSLVTALILLPSEKETAFGLHLHYMYNFEHSNWGLGTGVERIFDEHGHTTIGLAIGYRLFEQMHLALTPGISLRDGAGNNSEFALHGEVLYEFILWNFHIGPTIGIGLSPDETHLSAGLHLGIATNAFFQRSDRR